MKTPKEIRRILNHLNVMEARKELRRDQATAARAAIREYHRAAHAGDKHRADRALAKFVELFVKNED